MKIESFAENFQRGRTAEYYMRSAGTAKNLATNPGRFYDDHPRRMGAAPLPALGSAFSRKSMPDVNRAGRDTRTRTNSESSVVSDQDDHREYLLRFQFRSNSNCVQERVSSPMASVGLTRFGRTENGDDKDEVPDEEVDSGIQSEKEKMLDDDRVNIIENFARASARELIEKTAREFAETRASSNMGSSSRTGDGDEEAEVSPSGDREAEEDEAEENVDDSHSDPGEANDGEADEVDMNQDPGELEDTENASGENFEESEGRAEETPDVEENQDKAEATLEEDFGEEQEAAAPENKLEAGNSDAENSDNEVEIEPQEELGQNEVDAVGEEDSGKSYSEVKEFIHGALSEEQTSHAVTDAEQIRPPLTPQNSFVGEAEPSENFERSLSAIPEAASPAANLELREDGECRWHDGMRL